MTSLFPGYNPPQAGSGPADFSSAADLPRIRAIIQAMQGGGAGIGNAGIPGGPQLVDPMRANPVSTMIMGTRGPDGAVTRGYHPDDATAMRPPIAPSTAARSPMPGDYNNFNAGPTRATPMPMTTGGGAVAPVSYPQQPVDDPRLAQFSPGMRARLKPFFMGR